jgi:pimeloyl-ACP methyl ester carboxylesterase
VPLTYDRAGPSGALPVVLVHAGIADRRMWDPQWDALRARHDTVRVDLRGFGDSATPPGGPFSHADDLAATLDALGVSRCHLVGASLGAGVVVELALARPSLAASLLLCPPGGSLLAELTPDLREFLEAEDAALQRGDLDAAVEANISAWVVGPGRSPAEVPTDVLDQVRVMQRRAFDIQLPWGDVDEVEPDPPVLDRLSSVAAPTLVLIGGHDLETSKGAARRVSAEVAGATRVDWPDVAHLPTMERPHDFLDLLLDWVAGR